MLGIIVGTHGKFAEELVKTCEMICGQTTNVRAVTLVPGEGADDLAKKYAEAIEAMDTADGLLFLNDLFGGSPYNAACRIAVEHETYGIVTGVNLPMLIEAVGCQSGGDDIKEVMERAVQAGNMGTQTFHTSTINQEEDDL